MKVRVGWGHLEDCPVVDAQAVLSEDGEMVLITIPKLVRHAYPVMVQISREQLAMLLDLIGEE